MRIALPIALFALGCGQVGTDLPETPRVDASMSGPIADEDEDGVADGVDNCPALANPDQKNGDIQPVGVATTIAFAMRPTPELALEMDDDNLSNPLDLGFDFVFFGETYRSVWVSSNGFVAVIEPPEWGEGFPAPDIIPAPFTPNGVIAGFWGDLDPGVAGEVHVGLVGEAPDRAFVAEYRDVPHFKDGDKDGDPTYFPVTMQIVLREDSGIEVHCEVCSPDDEDHSQGIEDPSGHHGAALLGRSYQRFSVAKDSVEFTTRKGEPDEYGDACDNCPALWSTDNNDRDADGVGDACDNCQDLANPGQEDTDGDRLGNACDNCQGVYDEYGYDEDEDSLGDSCDNCPYDANQDQSDEDGDEYGDACDNCPAVPNEDQQDTDEDGVGDACES